MIKIEKFAQAAACMVLCITLPVRISCNYNLENAVSCEEAGIESISEQMAEAVVGNVETEKVLISASIAEEKEKPAETAEIAETIETVETVETVQTISKEQELLASIIFCEAGNQPYEGQVAVGAVVINRVGSELYPNSIEEVIYQSGQFGPVSTGWLDQVRDTSSYTPQTMAAASDALSGADPVEGCLYFDQGGYGIQIGAHYFH